MSSSSGFGKEAGPTSSSLSQPLFGPPPSIRHFGPRGPDAVGRVVRSPPLIYQSSGLASYPYQSTGIPRRPEAVERSWSPPSVLGATHPTTSPPHPSVAPPALSPARQVNRQGSFLSDDALGNPKGSAVTSFVASRYSGTNLTAKVGRFQDLKRARSPPTSHAAEEGILSTFNQNFLQRPSLSPPAWEERPNYAGNYRGLVARQDLSVYPHAGSHDSVYTAYHTRSPPVSADTEALQDNILPVQKDHKRTSMSPHRFSSRSSATLTTLNSQIPYRILPSGNAADAASIRTTGSSMVKRTRSPPFPTVDRVSQGNPYSTQDDTERERQAKAKRLARFKEELSETFENSQDTAEQNFATSGREQAIIGKKKFSGGHPIESTGDFTNSSTSADFEGSETSNIIIGLCPDMCPESERAERERKGDLDHYERLDGDRNQTNKFLAVKKYNRTAEREASLIRPLPILQKTFDYLLDLLDQPYSDNFLGMYNFMWDRMRAIRMDLRMQHIFSQESITMLEQMIRLHIIAMHELCENKTGEGSIEGFDAHLNIEQMNKTSVELFQMYDDDRKKGINVSTETEFRGYYALLKLDKHPGYKVEPAELSLDLAKMTPQIRQTPEVLIARDVARACRTGNFITFFRLARKASYLQACLMHAHFAKLRTQALASLHSGLQNNQGLPVTHVAKWLAMEEEVDELLNFHGFAIKEFEEPYMVKDSSFLNADKDYPTKCSNLVQLKRSKRIVDDVSPPSQEISFPTEAANENPSNREVAHSALVDTKSSTSETDEEIPDSGVVSSPKRGAQMEPMIEQHIVNQQGQDDHKVAGACILPWDVSRVRTYSESQPVKLAAANKHDTLFGISPKRKMPSSMEIKPLHIASILDSEERSPSDKVYTREKSTLQIVAISNSRDEEPFDMNQASENEEVMENYQDEEVALAKLKLIVRLWRRRSLKQKELREQRFMAANAALSSLSLGPPIRQTRDHFIAATGFDIDHVMEKRHEKHEKSWSRLNVSEEIAGVLGRRNPEAKCLCWKIILCSQINDQGDKIRERSQAVQGSAGSWLFSKLMPSVKDDDGETGLLISSPGLAIWRKWLPSQSGDPLKCCLSVVKDVRFDNLNETVAGASAVLFLVSESIPWNLQKAQLHDLLTSIPSGSSLPLLVLCGSNCKEDPDLSSIIVEELGLQGIDKSQISSFLIVFLIEDKQLQKCDGFFSDMRLREGLQWLASESPLQPDLHCIKTRDLVLTHLNPSLDILEKRSDYEVSPSHCILAFNEALERSLEEIAAAAKSNPASWPCPEISLLENCQDERKVVNCYLPSIGWSSSERIESFLHAIRDSKLPIFPDTAPWLGKGANTVNEIEDLRSQLENCLVRYLTESSGMMGLLLATKEAYVMLQRSARLELHDSSYHVVPKWVMIFKRIFSWQLTSLSSGPFSSAFILRCHYVDQASRIPNELCLEGGGSLNYLSQPFLDEIIGAGCSTFPWGIDEIRAEGFYPPPRTIATGDVWKEADASDLMENQRVIEQKGDLIEAENIDHVPKQLNTTAAEIMFAEKLNKEANKLSKLLEQCNMVQNSIGEKLSIYF